MLEHTEFLKDFSSKTHPKDATKIGAALLQCVLKCGVPIIQEYKSHKGNKTGSLVTTAVYREILDAYVADALYHFVCTPPPMIVPPRDWTGYNKGGYLVEQISLIKEKYYGKTVTSKPIHKVLPIVNKLQRTPWRINTRIMDLLHDVVENQIVDPKSPPELRRLIGGLSNGSLESDPAKIREQMGYVFNKHTYSQDKKKIEKMRQLAEAEWQRAFQLRLALGIASDYCEYDAVYFVYQLDYRGRVYPVQPHLNPQTTKYIKPLLEFADGEYLDTEGVHWLKVHIANCYGLDKKPYEERIQWVDDNYQLILDVGDAPLEHKKEWIYCDSPYEFVAACGAFIDHLEGRKVHVPIQLDAVNSGTQVYSGILLDAEGAKETCVIGSTRSDLYQTVADRVNELLTNGEYPSTITFTDKEGVEQVYTTHVEANSLKGKVTRKLVKRNVMTVPYSVSRRGMSDQLWAEMEDMELSGKNFWKGVPYVVNKLLTDLNHRAIYEVINGAKLGQEYLTSISRLVDRPATYTTPIYDFPVALQSWKLEQDKVLTELGSLALSRRTNGINRLKHTNGIAPNVIHSLDSMILYGVVDRADYTLGVIHDCFLVHPNNGTKVQNHYKESYVALMRTNPLEYIGSQIDTEGVVEVPCIGTLDLDDVFDSEYIIS